MLPFYLTFWIGALNVMINVVMPESLQKHKRKRFNALSSVNPLTALKLLTRGRKLAQVHQSNPHHSLITSDVSESDCFVVAGRSPASR